MSDHTYLTAEAAARLDIDKMLVGCGWVVQQESAVNLFASQGVAIREFHMAPGHGRADYMLFVNGQALGTLEAKKVGSTLTGVEMQSGKYLVGLPTNLPALLTPLPFGYESTGVETRFTNRLDPDPRSRPIFAVHRPETLWDWAQDALRQPEAPTFLSRLKALPPLFEAGLWPAQVTAVRNLEISMADNRPRALIQMTTGSGKTFTACNISYRLVKHGGAKRILFLVDRANLGRQTLKEFQQFVTPDDGRKFSELYNVQHLQSNVIDSASRVTIATIQRIYSILTGQPEMDPELDEESTGSVMPAHIEVAYNPKIPIEAFDVVIVDECHRSIYGLWRQVIEYFDASLIGLTATPSKQTLGFFNQNLVMEYGHEQAVADGVNVDFEVYRIKTAITQVGSSIEAGTMTGFKNRETRKMRWEKLDEPLTYDANQLDRRVVAKDQIRTVIKTFKNKLFTEIFPGRTDVPKTLIFAKDDAHADDIVQIVREEFSKGNDFAVKITYKTTGQKPEDLLAEFRNSYSPRIAVTVDMIATGTDVKPLECVFFMRAVQSRTFFEQMKGRGVRVMNNESFRAVTPDAKAKTHFVIVDAIGVTETELSDTQPLDKEPTVGLEKLLKQLSLGDRTPELVSTIAGRLARLTRVITKDDRAELTEAAGGLELHDLVRAIVDALDPDAQVEKAKAITGDAEPSTDAISAAAVEMIDAAVLPLASNPVFRNKLLDVRRSYEQVVDEVSKDQLMHAGPSVDSAARAKQTVTEFRKYIEENKDEITALQVLYSRPYRQRLTFKDIKQLANAIGRPPQQWTPEILWQAYQSLDTSKVRGSGGRMLTDMVSLVRFALEQDPQLVPYKDQVAARFESWLATQRKIGREFSAEQLMWLGLIKEHVASSLAIAPDDFDYAPFIQHGGLGKAFAVFGNQFNPILEELTTALAA
jgi:type I restriction enzyme R subunit